MLLLEPEDYLVGNGKSTSHASRRRVTVGLTASARLFVVEGAITVALSIVVYFALPDCTYRIYNLLDLPFFCLESSSSDLSTVPGNTKWLSPVEKAFLQARLPQNAPRSSEKDFVGREIIATLRDKRLWLFTLSWALMTCGKNGIDFYRPTIISNMGFR